MKISIGAMVSWLLGACKRRKEEITATPTLTPAGEAVQVTEEIDTATNTATVTLTPTAVPTATAEPVLASEVTIPTIKKHIFKVTLVKREYKLYVALPRSHGSSAKAYPVLYVLDANALFLMTAEIAGWLSIQNLLPEIIIVGIAYNVPNAESWIPLRIRDYSPTYYNPNAGIPGGLDFSTSGGALKFLQIIREEIKPFIQENYQADPLDAAIHGHSLGGLFALYALFQHPDTFNRYIASSPSLWWDDEVLLRYESEYASAHDDLAAKVYVAIGGLEGSGVNDVHTVEQVLNERQYPNLELHTHVFDEEEHNSVVPITIAKGLRKIFTEEQP